MVPCQEPEGNAIVSSVSFQEVQPMDENVGAVSCCGLIKYSFRQWITDFMCKLVECWGKSS